MKFYFSDFFNYCLITSNSTTEAIELVDMNILSYALCTDSTLSLEWALTKVLLQNLTAKAALVTIISTVAPGSLF